MSPEPLEPLKSPNAETKSDEVLVDQAIFGYGHGHQLLKSTTAFDDESRLRLDRLTDGTGAESLAGFDGYLSGFPLPDGRYVFTRTWRAIEAKRPGSVWTHAAIIGRDALARISDPEPIIRVLTKRPQVHPDADPLKALRVSVANTSPVPASELEDWSALITALTASDSTTVGMTCRSATDGEAELRLLWSWLWPGVRNGFAFSFGATNRLSLERGRYFDLIGVPESLKVEGEGLTIDPHASSPAGTAIWTEITASRRGELSQYVKFCGAETNRRTAAAVLANVWAVATNENLDRDARQLALAEAIVESFPDPTTMRRLKRSVFTENGRLSVDWDPGTTLEILASPGVARCILADDVDLGSLIERTLRNPVVLLHAYESLDSASAELPTDTLAALVPTVLTQLPISAEPAISRFATPAWIDALVAASSRLTAKVIRDALANDRQAWAEGFWSLAVEDQDRVSSAYVASGRTPRSKSESVASKRAPSPNTAGWVAAYAPTIAGGVNWLVTCHPNDKARQSAMIDLASAVAGYGHVPRPWVAAVHDRALAQAGVKAAKSERASAAVASALLLLIDPEIGAANDGRLKSWAKVLQTGIDGVGGAHLLRYAQRNEPPAHIEFDLLAIAFTEAWRALAERDSATWDALGDFPADVESGLEWDRAYRLTAGLASLVRSWRVSEPQFEWHDLLGTTYRVDPRPAQQLDDILNNRAPVQQAQPVRKVQQTRRGPWGQLRQMADDVRSTLGF